MEEVFREALGRIREQGERARTAEDAWAGLCGYLDAVFGMLAADRGANDLMTTGLSGVPSLDALHAHNRETLAALPARMSSIATRRSWHPARPHSPAFPARRHQPASMARKRSITVGTRGRAAGPAAGNFGVRRVPGPADCGRFRGAARGRRMGGEWDA
ncbi:hypothetical protein [Streptomyces sp. NBC_00448]|uniref:hypothetical protein n=1 Tax=Streptomyces sp. NBC_00448 TaxID=2903652 RepID=UPI003FA77070